MNLALADGLPSDCGRRFVPALIDQIAKTDPARHFASIPQSSCLRDGLDDVTYRRFALAIDRCAWWIEKQLGSPSRQFENIAYLGSSDIRLAIFIIACIKAGCTAFVMSPRNSLDDSLSLLENADCTKVVASATILAIESQIKSKRSMKCFLMPETDYWLRPSDQDERPYPYDKSFEEAKCEPFVAVYTSGSTGPPKIVTIAHGAQTALDAYQMIPAFQQRQGISSLLRGTRLFMSFPLFHCAAIGLVLGTNISMGVTTGLYSDRAFINGQDGGEGSLMPEATKTRLRKALSHLLVHLLSFAQPELGQMLDISLNVS